MPRDIDKVIAALDSPVRREILTLIWDRELPAGGIAAAFALTKPTISQHLAVLRDAGLVAMTPAGTSRRYRARQEALDGLRGALEGPGKWTPATTHPPGVDAGTVPAVVVRVAVTTTPATTFAAFTDAEVYSRWLGTPVTITEGRFAATMEWGTQVRGSYDVVCPPELIVMRWDFEDDTIPVPGGEFVGYLRVRPDATGGSVVEVHQLVDTAAQAAFMEVAWGEVLGRFQAGVAAASEPTRAMPKRPRRAKRRRTA